MRVLADIEYTHLINDNEVEIPSVTATCHKCGLCTESFGQSEFSVKRCLALLNEECSLGENNFYVSE